jgi:hypothetical protein
VLPSSAVIPSDVVRSMQAVRVGLHW